VFRPALLAACVALALCIAPTSARADDMDLALSRLRIARETGNCGDRSGGTFCADQELFERLVSELAVAMAPAVIGPARTTGARGFALTIGTTITRIEGGQLYWTRGTEGDRGLSQPIDDLETPEREQDGAALGFNESPPAALAWNHIQLRKGLPFGLELGALLGQGLQTSMWTFGTALKWSLFEGFRSGLGQLPDVAVQGAISRSVGSSQATLQLYALDLTFSKPYVIEQTWSVSPFLGLQWLHADVESGVVDLTPGGPPRPSAPAGQPAPEDAYRTCRPKPGHQLTDPDPATLVCTAGDASDFANDVVFEPVSQSRMRMFLGAQTRYDMFVFAASLLLDVVVPEIAADMSERHLDSNDLAHQVAFSVSVGAAL
jgi:hypothetical protein